MKRAYLAGPMTGLPDYNFPAFFAAEESLLASTDWAIVNPARLDLQYGRVERTENGYHTTEKFDRFAVLRQDVRQVSVCDAIVLLPGWEDSAGCRVELEVAKACGLEVYHYDPDDHSLVKQHSPFIIGVAGYGRVGKDSFGAALVEDSGFHRIAFADAIKDVLSEMDPLVPPPGKHYTTTAIPLDKALDVYGPDGLKEDTNERSYRPLLQRLGLAIRETVGPSAWVDAALAEAEKHPLVVVTDVRFPNEARAIKARGGVIVRIERPGYGPANDHISETAMDDWPYDFRVNNNGTLIDLGWEARVIARALEVA